MMPRAAGFYPPRQGYPNMMSPTPQKLYGAVPAAGPEEEEQGAGAPTKEGLAHIPLHPSGGRRARIDVWQVLLCALLPVVIFAITAGALSFQLRYSSWPLAWLIAILCVLPGVFAGYLGFKASKDGDGLQAKWMYFLCALCVLSWLFAVLFGSDIYSSNMKPYYDMSGLNYYPSIDPSASGEGYIDAGRILFQPGSRLDINKAMGVKISDTYCVAPVINPSPPKGQEVQYDYWAVGVGCCSSIQPQTKWTCPEVSNARAHAGMRLMQNGDSSRPFFRMAVQEAEATYKITAKHPIFIHWMEDPTTRMASWSADGTRLFWQGFFSLLVCSLFLSISAGLFFSRASMQSQPCKGTGFVRYTTLNPDHDFMAEEGYEEPTSFKNVTL